tara:strand:- start:145 stop:648 length:504 start_codon:yes stop_codon:yes gene_type:complete
MSNNAQNVKANNKPASNKATSNKAASNKAVSNKAASNNPMNNKGMNNKGESNKKKKTVVSKTKKVKVKKDNNQVKLLKKEIMRLKLNQEDLERKHNKLKKMYSKSVQENKQKTQKIKRMLSSSDKIIPSLKDLKNNILVSYQTFEQLNTLLGNIYLEKEKPPTQQKK